MEKATFGAGCFWHVEEVFAALGVKTVVGFMGGSREKPTYKEVCGGRTGHAEVVQVAFDSKRVSYRKLLNVFWENHDPTTPGRQGPDVGDQYRSVIFYHTEKQRKEAIASKKIQQKKYTKKIVTQILPAKRFWTAGQEHQQYFKKHRTVGALMRAVDKLTR